jgi:PAS domain S-box-containing protein
MTIATIEEGRILDANDRAFELFGYSREEGIGRTAGELKLWENPADRARLVWELKERGLPVNPAVFTVEDALQEILRVRSVIEKESTSNTGK